MVAMCAALVWFDVKWLAIPLVTVLGAVVMLAAFALLSPPSRFDSVIVLGWLVLSLHSVWTWYMIPEEEVAPESELS